MTRRGNIEGRKEIHFPISIPAGGTMETGHSTPKNFGRLIEVASHQPGNIGT